MNVIKPLVGIAVALAIGFISGAQWVSVDVENARHIGIAATLIREDQMLKFFGKIRYRPSEKRPGRIFAQHHPGSKISENSWAIRYSRHSAAPARS